MGWHTDGRSIIDTNQINYEGEWQLHYNPCWVVNGSITITSAAWVTGPALGVGGHGPLALRDGGDASALEGMAIALCSLRWKHPLHPGGPGAISPPTPKVGAKPKPRGGADENAVITSKKII